MGVGKEDILIPSIFSLCFLPLSLLVGLGVDPEGKLVWLEAGLGWYGVRTSGYILSSQV